MGRSRRRGRDVPRARVIEAPTAHGTARIEPDPHRPTGRLLTLGHQDASYVDLADPTHLEWPYVRRIGDVVDVFRPPRAAIDAVHLGGGAATLARYVEATRPRSRQVVVEIDPDVVALAREHLGLRTHPRLRVRVGDAAELLPRRPDASVDLVVTDAFDRPAEIPAALTTPAFAAELRRVLRPSGVHVLNVVDGRHVPRARDHAGTLARHFEHVAIVAPRAMLRGRAAGNALVLASASPLPLDALARRAAGSIDREEVVPVNPGRGGPGTSKARHRAGPSRNASDRRGRAT
jgi:SAM-dependent methyltransferase